MTPFTPENFMERVLFALTEVRDEIGHGSTHKEVNAAISLAHNFFELLSEMNTNLNRVAVAQEAMVAMNDADFADAVAAAVEQQTEKLVNERVKEKEKRSFIGKKSD